MVQSVLRTILLKDEAALATGSQSATSLAVKTSIVQLRKLVDQSCKTQSGVDLFTRSNLFALICTTFAVVAEVNGTTSPVWPVLIQVLALAFDSLAAEERFVSGKGAKGKPILHGTLLLARRTLREVSNSRQRTVTIRTA